jgi:hypothetical protein
VPNPAHFKLDSPLDLLSPIAGVAFELWTTEAGYTFDSVLLGAGDAGLAAAASYMRHTWRPRNKAEVSGKGVAAGLVGHGRGRGKGMAAGARAAGLDAAQPVQHVTASATTAPCVSRQTLAAFYPAHTLLNRLLL